MSKKKGLILAGGWGLCCVGINVFGGLAPNQIKDPAKTLARARNPLPIAEEFLAIQETDAVKGFRTYLTEKGKEALALRIRFLEELYAGNNAGAVQVLELIEKKDSWVVSRGKDLTQLYDVQRSFGETKSDHFLVRTSTDDAFLASYAVPSLENSFGRLTEFYGSALPLLPAVVEIYPTLDSYSLASGVSKEAIEYGGSVSTARYGRVMVLSPKATSFGYRWIDRTVQAYVQHTLNYAAGGNSPGWLLAGAARYLERSWQSPAGVIHTPGERALLTRAVLAGSESPTGLLPFEKMELSSLNSMSQSQKILALAEAADAVDFLVQEFGIEKLRDLLRSFRDVPRPDAFLKVLGMSEKEFETNWLGSLAGLTEVPTDLARGALAGTIPFGAPDDLRLVGEEIREDLEAGDHWHQKGKIDEAVREYKKGIEKEPDNGVALERLARIYLSTQKADSAEELLKRAIEKNSSYAPPFVLMGTLCFEDGRYDEAQLVLQRALEINPFEAKIHEILGLIAVDVGNFVLAKESLLRALRLDPTNETVRQSLKHMPKAR